MLKLFFGITPEWLTAIAGLSGAVIALWQLNSIRRTSRANFIRDLLKEFYTAEASRLIHQIWKNELSFVDGTTPHFVDKQRNKIDQDCVDGALLNRLEIVGTLEARRVVKIGEVYDFFYWYIHTICSSTAIKDSLRWWQRNSPDDPNVYEYLKTLSYKCEAYHEKRLLKRSLLSHLRRVFLGPLTERPWP